MKLPNSIESEKVVICKLLKKDRIAVETVVDYSEDFFFEDSHKEIFKKVIADIHAGVDYDELSIHLALENNPHYKTSGGHVYLKTLLVDYNYGFQTHFDKVRDAYFLRSKMMLYAKAQLSIIDNKENLGKQLEEYEFQMFELGHKFNAQTSTLEMAGTTTDTVISRLDELINSSKKYSGLPTGIQELDELTTGLHGGDSTIVAARPSVGKSAFAGSVLGHHVTFTPGFVGVFFNLEMPKSQIVMRLISSIGYIPLSHIRAGRLSDFEWARFLYAVDALKASKLYIDDASNLSTISMQSRIQNILLKEKRIDLVVVDYLQLLTSLSTKGTREQEVAQVSRGIKLAAKSMNIPIMLLSQLSRASEKRLDHKPVLSDLRDTGSAEQDHDNVIFLYREELYNATVENKNLANIIVSKQRNGALGDISSIFLKDITKFVGVKS